MNIERGPKIRIVGGASPEAKEEAKKEIEKALFEHFESLPPEHQEKLKKLEYPKSEKELALIEFANKETSELMKEAGIEPYDVPVDNFHIVPPRLYKELTGTEEYEIAMAFIKKQGIFLNAQEFRDNPVYFGAVLLHELLHLKALLSLEVEEEGKEVKKDVYRTGISVHSSLKYKSHGKPHSHFEGLHEAIVAETEKRLLPKLLEHPALSKEKEWLMSEEAKKLKKKIAKEKKIPEEDIIWVEKVGEKENWEIVGYPCQREVLNYVCREIQKEFPDKYKSPDEVYKEFLKAHFSGRLLSLSRIFEKTFGKGSFRLLGNMGVEPESGVLYLETLKKARARQLKKKTIS